MCHLQHNFYYASNLMIDDHTLNIIFINDTSFRSYDMACLIRTPIKCYHTRDQFLLYKKSIIDIWNR